MIRYIDEESPESVDELADGLGRDRDALEDGMKHLTRFGITTYVEQSDGTNAPRLKFEHLVIEPLV